MKAILRALSAIVLPLILGAGLTVPALADEESEGPGFFRKYQDFEDAAAVEAGAKSALDTAQTTRNEKEVALEGNKKALEEKAAAERAAQREYERNPSSSTRTKKLQADSDASAARNAVGEAEAALKEAEKALEEAKGVHRKAKAEADRLKEEFEALKGKGEQPTAPSDSPAGEGPGSSVVGAPAPAPDAQVTATAPAGDVTVTTTDSDSTGGLAQLIAHDVIEGRNALAAMDAALEAPCDTIAFEAARQRVQSALRSLAPIADFYLVAAAFGWPMSPAGQGMGLAALGAMNEIAGRWKGLEQAWATRCGQGAMCAAPQVAPAGGGGPGGGSGFPPPPPRLDPKRKDPDGQPDPGGPQPPGSSGGGFAGAQPPCPDTPELAHYRGLLSEVEEQINERGEDALKARNAGPGERATASRQLQDQLYPQRDYLKDQIQKETDKACQRQRAAAQEQAAQTARFQAQLAAPSPGEVLDRSMKNSQLQNLKDANDRLQTHIQQGEDFFKALEQRVASIDREIAALRGVAGSEDRIGDLTFLRNGLVQSYLRHQQAYRAEKARLEKNVEFNRWIVDPAAVEASEVQRVLEYKAKRDELVRTQEIRQVSEAAFQEKFVDLERQIAEAEAAGDSARAAQLGTELENMKAGKQDWDRFWQNRENRLAREVEDLQIRNGLDGVGPGLAGDQAFGEQWTKYRAMTDAEGNPKYSELQGDPFGPVLDANDKLDFAKQVYQYADGARTRKPDDNRSVVWQFLGELSLVDAVTNMPSYVAGVVEGTVEAVVDLFKLVYGAGAVVGESAALATGAEGETPNLDVLNAALSQARPSVVVDITVGAGEVIYKGDVRGFGRGVGMVAGPDAVLAATPMVAAVASKVLKGADKATDAAKLASGAARATGEAADATKVASAGAKAGDQVAGTAAGVTELSPTVRAGELTPTVRAGESSVGTAGSGARDLTPTVRAGESSAATGAAPSGGTAGSGTRQLTPTVRAGETPVGTAGTGARDLTPTVRAGESSASTATAGAAGELTPTVRAAGTPSSTPKNPWVRLAKAAEEGGNTRAVAQELVGTRVTIEGEVLELGDYIDGGTSGHVFKVKGREDAVLKVFPDKEWLDSLPDEINPVKGMQAGDEALSKLPAGDRVDFTEILGKGTTPDGRPAFLVRRIPPDAYTMKKGITLSLEEQNAVAELYETLRRNGLDWWDGHVENIYFYREGGKLKAGTFDPDRILTTAQVAGDHGVIQGTAMALYKQIAGGKATWAKGAESQLLEHLAGTPAEIKDVLAVRWGHVKVDPKTGRFVDGTWTVENWAKANPDGLIARQAPAPASTVSTAPASTVSAPGSNLSLGGSPEGSFARQSTHLVETSPLTINLTGAGLAAGVYHLLGHGPLAKMTEPHLMCWSRLYMPILTPWGVYLVSFDTHNPGFFQDAPAKDDKVVFVEQNKEMEAQLAGIGEVER